MKDILENVGQSTNKLLSYHLKGEGAPEFNDYSILRKPIGVASKSYGFMEQMLYRNIGSHQFEFDGYATFIGMNANPYLNSNYNPWFMLDEERQKYDNYLSYINKMYFHGTMLPPNFMGQSDKIKLLDLNELIEENSRVGVIHHYNLDNVLGARLLIPNGATNPNGYDDTRLGVINNFYLSSTLYRSLEKTLKNDSSSYNIPSMGYNERTVKSSYSVTQGAYSRFGLKGEFGLNNGSFSISYDGVTPQNVLIGDIIPWSTSDHNYNSQNLNRIGGILGVDSAALKDDFNDITKNSKISTQYNPFGNFYSITYSLGLISASGGKTQEYITKSMYGIDLLSNIDVPSLDYKDGNLDTLRKYSQKKYFVHNGSRGTNYIDEMTSIDVSFETTGENDLEIIRLQLNDAGNDNLSTYNTFLIYAEAEKNNRNVNLESGIANAGTQLSRYEVYNSNNIKSKNDIIDYTNKQFKNNKFKTLIARFHSDEYNNVNDVKVNKDYTSTAVSQYGLSHGRNLLKKEHKNSKTNGYSDPYCRVWTYHKQYSKYSDMIRPFVDSEEELIQSLKNLQPNRQVLNENGVLKNGYLHIAPNEKNDITRFMFSIENLAWKDNILLDEYTKGPLNGRIMWFPPYGLTFNENVTANWKDVDFIGRGEKIYSYVNTQRGGNLSFQMLIDHPSLLNTVKGVSESNNDVDDVDSYEQQVLRFFAGCEILKNIQQGNNNDEENIKQPNNNDFIRQDTSTKKISFDVYFPNYYSGVDDGINAIYYLLWGIGDEIQYDLRYEKYYEGEKKYRVVGGYEQNYYFGASCAEVWEEDTPNVSTMERKLTTLKLKSDGSNFDVKIKGIRRDDNEFNYWGYRIDNEYKTRKLKREVNYLDEYSYGLNGKVSETQDQEMLCVSFNDFACYMGLNRGEGVNFENVEKLKKMFANSMSYVYKIDMTAYSTAHGNPKENEILAKNRLKTIKKWLVTKPKFNSRFTETYYTNQKVTTSHVSLEDSKKNRKVNVTIWLQTSNFSFADVNQQTIKEPKLTLIDTTPKEMIQSNINYFDNMTFSNIKETKNNGTFFNDVEKLAFENSQEYQEKVKKLNENSQNINLKVNISEYDYFKEIDSNDNILRHKIIEKIKYFDPAFHSITPEGFNSRLTFLHQCTRQGATNSAFDTQKKNLRNLSFGAPPICVLRIGDFYNTKIIIESLTINYDDASWDLNDEGIGVMPMLAKIDISFKFIGGSDLSGPIAKLQNAVSFNYYANTRVYDNNADKKIE